MLVYVVSLSQVALCIGLSSESESGCTLNCSYIESESGCTLYWSM